MEDQNRIPEWVDALGEQVAAGTEFKGVGHLEMRYSAPEENEWGVHLLALAPALFEVGAEDSDDEATRLLREAIGDDDDLTGESSAEPIGPSAGRSEGASPEPSGVRAFGSSPADDDAVNGEIGYGVLHDCDLLSVQRALDEVTSLSVGHEDDGGLRVTLGGKAGGNEVVILIYTTPFEDMADDDDDDDAPGGDA